MFFQQFFGFQTIAGNVRVRKRNFKIVAELAREIPLPLDSHPFPRRAEDRDVEAEQLVLPGCLCPIDGHRHDEVHRLFLQQRAGRRKLVAVISWSGERRRVMRVIARKICHDVRAAIFEDLGCAVGEGADAQYHDRH